MPYKGCKGFAILCNETPSIRGFRYRKWVDFLGHNAIVCNKTPCIGGFCYGE